MFLITKKAFFLDVFWCWNRWFFQGFCVFVFWVYLSIINVNKKNWVSIRKNLKLLVVFFIFGLVNLFIYVVRRGFLVLVFLGFSGRCKSSYKGSHDGFDKSNLLFGANLIAFQNWYWISVRVVVMNPGQVDFECVIDKFFTSLCP